MDLGELFLHFRGETINTLGHGLRPLFYLIPGGESLEHKDRVSVKRIFVFHLESSLQLGFEEGKNITHFDSRHP